MVGYPSEQYFKNMMRDGMIPNCSVSLDDIKISNIIFELNAPSLKGRMAGRQPNPVVSNYAKIMKEILQLNKTVLV